MQTINEMKLAYLSDMKINPDTAITSATMLTTRSAIRLSTSRQNNEFINMSIRDGNATTLGIRNCRQAAIARDIWRRKLAEAKTCNRL